MGVLLAHLLAVLDANRYVNLTAARDLPAAVDILALSAFAVVWAWPAERPPPRRAVDLGTGNGLPGVAVALAWPEADVLLVERRGRKARAVEACLAAAGLDRVAVLTADGREVLARRPELRGTVDLVTVRAVGPLAEVARLAAPWLAPGGRLAHWKGRGLSREEIAAGEVAAREAGLDPLPVLSCEDDAGPARLVVYECPDP